MVHKSLLRRCIVTGTALGAFLLGAREAHAWKPKTHVYLAERAYDEAVRTGKVSIYATDYARGVVTQTKIGDFDVEPNLLRALRAYPEKYFAGVLGPDGYPDVLTGQMRIHPPGTRDRNLCNGPDADCDGAGTDPYLQRLWGAAFDPSATDAQKAFVAGYLAHAAGDMYAHTFMNKYAGGIFDTGSANALKHIALEGYIGERTPELLDPTIYTSVATNGVEGIQHFIVDNLVDVPPALESEANKKYSVPWLLLAARLFIQANIDAFNRDSAALYQNLQDVQRERDQAWLIAYCSDVFRHDPTRCANVRLDDGSTCNGDACHDLGRGIAYGAKVLAFDTTVIPAVWLAYNGHEVLGFWIPYAHDVVMANLDRARYDWIDTSNQVAIDLFFNPESSTKFGEAGSKVATFGGVLLARVLGVPEDAIQEALRVLGFIDMVTSALAEWKADLMDAVLWKPLTRGYTKDQVKEMFAKPHAYLDAVFAGSNPPATVASMNQIMHVAVPAPGDNVAWASDRIDRFSVDPPPMSSQPVFPAAFNTVTMIKLSLLGRQGMTDLLAKLGASNLSFDSPVPGAPPNAMLGFLNTIDGSNQWAANSRMVLARSCAAYQRIFLKQDEPTYASTDPRLVWEPADPCAGATTTLPMLDLQPVGAGWPLKISARQRVDFSSSLPATFAIFPSVGQVQPAADGRRVTFIAPDSIWRDQTITMTAATLGPSPRMGWTSFSLLQDLRISALPSGKKGTAAFSRVTLHGGESRRFAVVPAVPVTWRVVQGAGRMGPAATPMKSGRGASVDGIDTTQLARYDAQIKTAALAHKSCGTGAPVKGCSRAFETVLAAKKQRDAFVKTSLDTIMEQKRAASTVASTYYAPATIDHEERVVLEARSEDGRTATVELWLEPPEPTLTVLNAPKVVAAGQAVQLTASESIPIAWSVVGGAADGTMGEPQSPVRANLVQTQIEPFKGRMKELHPVVAAPKLSRKLGDQKPELDSRAQELTTKRLASATQVKSSTATVGKALQQIAAIDSTYHAPATVTAPRTVTVKGAAQDGSGRTITVAFTLQPPGPQKLVTPPNKRIGE